MPLEKLAAAVKRKDEEVEAVREQLRAVSQSRGQFSLFFLHPFHFNNGSILILHFAPHRWNCRGAAEGI